MTAVRMTQADRREVRDWASKKDASIKAQGTLPQYVIEAWNRSHPDRQFVEVRGFTGRLNDLSERR